MPVVVDEVVVSVEVPQQRPDRESASGPGASAIISPDQRNAIVREAVELVLEILERRAEP